jgi:hypothetical protein
MQMMGQRMWEFHFFSTFYGQENHISNLAVLVIQTGQAAGYSRLAAEYM